MGKSKTITALAKAALVLATFVLNIIVGYDGLLTASGAFAYFAKSEVRAIYIVFGFVWLLIFLFIIFVPNAFVYVVSKRNRITKRYIIMCITLGMICGVSICAYDMIVNYVSLRDFWLCRALVFLLFS